MNFAQGPDKIPDQDELFEQLVNQYQQALLRVCFLYLRDREQARDAVQETFLRAYQHWRDFRGESSEKTWLMKIAMNICHDTQKSGWHRFFDRRITPDMLPQASVPFSPKEESLLIDVMRLPQKLREVTLLYYYQSLSVKEIAETLGIAHSSVSERLQRAQKKLRDQLEGRDSDE